MKDFCLQCGFNEVGTHKKCWCDACYFQNRRDLGLEKKSGNAYKLINILYKRYRGR